MVPQKKPQPLLPSFSVHKLKYADTNLPQCQFYHDKPIWQQKKNIFYYTHTMEIVHKTINNMKSVSISCFHYLNIICGVVLTLTSELLKTYPVSSVSPEQWSISTGTHLLDGMLIPQTVTPTDNVTVLQFRIITMEFCQSSSGYLTLSIVHVERRQIPQLKKTPNWRKDWTILSFSLQLTIFTTLPFIQ